ncbi:MAG: pyridoxine 5'-phosphate synthase [Bacteroidetes bacterium]|nr:pyridoxine 5'-phosphate synthase [Bacteroidota bacterium]MBM3425173.1 pyridoxine 5'-phosphate synthase [Bacteroidota bacterium]
MTRLSVNINKIATLRNARGGNMPNLIQFAIDCQNFGADGITVHPRPDERHVTASDALDLSLVVAQEYNIEGYPDERYFKILEKAKPAQATLVPDGPHILTSSEGWDIQKNFDFLKECLSKIHALGIRSSLFVAPELKQIEQAAKLGAHCIELYTGPYAYGYSQDRIAAVQPYALVSKFAVECGLGINAGHDLSLENLRFFKQNVQQLKEVSIGHALISDALYYGIENTIHLYKRCLID